MNFAYSKRVIQKTSYSFSSPFSFPQEAKLFSFLAQNSHPQPRKTNILIHGQRVLDIIAPRGKRNTSDNRQSHLRLIDDFLRANPLPFPNPQINAVKFHANADANEGSFSVLVRHHEQGLNICPGLLSNALSLCRFHRDVTAGLQIHGLAVTHGFFCNVYVGSALVSFYSKSGELDSAHKVFDEMPLRNVVTWTAIINGFAQCGRMDICFGLYRRMRSSTLNPNAFTFSSFLSACTGCGYLGQGRAVHCQTIRAGFGRCIHVANALVSMYCKCGNIEDALCIFRETENKDLVSWNSMIAGYALHGLAAEAIELFEKMKQQRRNPDAITFLGILTSCRHSGFIDAGRYYFGAMAKHGVEPSLDHYSCIVDLLGRAGMVEEARDFIRRMPISPNAIIWGSLLSSCRRRGNVWIGIEAAENRLELEPSCAATHLQLANLYAAVGYWDRAAMVRKLMKENGLKTDPGCSWIEIKNKIYMFRVEDRSNSSFEEILTMLEFLIDHIRDLRQWPDFGQFF